MRLYSTFEDWLRKGLERLFLLRAKNVTSFWKWDLLLESFCSFTIVKFCYIPVLVKLCYCSKSKRRRVCFIYFIYILLDVMNRYYVFWEAERWKSSFFVLPEKAVHLFNPHCLANQTASMEIACKNCCSVGVSFALLHVLLVGLSNWRLKLTQSST